MCEMEAGVISFWVKEGECRGFFLQMLMEALLDCQLDEPFLLYKKQLSDTHFLLSSREVKLDELVCCS